MNLNKYQIIQKSENEAYQYQLLQNGECFGLRVSELCEENRARAVLNIRSNKETITQLFSMCCQYCVSASTLPEIVEDYFFDYNINEQLVTVQ